MDSGPRGAEERVIEMGLGVALAQSANRLGILLRLLGTGESPSAGDTSVPPDDPAEDPGKGSDRQ